MTRGTITPSQLLKFIANAEKKKTNRTEIYEWYKKAIHKFMIIRWIEFGPYHFDGGTFSMTRIRSVNSVLFNTDFMLGQTHLHLLSSYDCA